MDRDLWKFETENEAEESRATENFEDAITKDEMSKLLVSSVTTTQEHMEQLIEEIQGIRSDIDNLKDLFTRRLLEDRQKNEILRVFEEQASYAVVEPFARDLILLLDRLERAGGDFSTSIAEELLDILQRRNVVKIAVGPLFDPKLHKVVRVVETPNASQGEILRVVRNGYRFGEKILRPVEVVVAKPGCDQDQPSNGREIGE